MLRHMAGLLSVRRLVDLAHFETPAKMLPEAGRRRLRHQLDRLGHVPGLTELGQADGGEEFMTGVAPLSQVAGPDTKRVRVRRISEEMQKDEELMGVLRRIGAQPGESVAVVATEQGGVMLGSAGETAEILPEAADHIFVTASDR
jgi:hypothetical protein